MKLQISAIVVALVVAAVAAGIVYGERDPNNPNRVILKRRLDPPSKVTQGQLQVVDKTGKPLGQCPLQHTSVSADVSGFVARVDVTQEFVNPLEERIEAVYVFPLPSDCAVDRMEMTVGDRTIRGVIKRREEARQIYEEARATGHVASLLDQERPNIFTQSVANILPGETVKIKISYVDVLKYEGGQYEFVFPMVVGPRYIPGGAAGTTGTGWSADTDKVPDASKITPPVTPEGTRAGHDISVAVSINAGVKLGDIKSVLHEVNVERRSDTEAGIALKDLDTIPNKDFILRYRVAGDEVRTGLLPNTRGAGDGYFSFVLVPPKTPTAAQIMPKEMIFVIDTSGSQMGWPIEKAKETMKLCIDQMNPGDTFNLMAFSNGVTPLFATPQPNTSENRAFAQEFLATRLGSGGTEMMKAIDACLVPPGDPKRLRVVCFMTDGYVGNDFAILEAIKQKIGNARLFSFGIGNSANRFLLDGMAKMGRGAVEYVTLQEQGEGAAQRFYDRISKPVLTDIQIDWGGLPVYDVYPEKIPDLFASKPVIIQGRYDKPMQGTIVVHGYLGGKLWEERIAVTLPGHVDQNQALPALWARARIADLMEQDYQGMQTGNVDPKVKEDITNVALDYQLMSQFTSFVAVEEKVVTENGKPKTVAVPVEMPEGVSYEGVFGEKDDKSQASSVQFKVTYAPSVAANSPASTGSIDWSAAGLRGPQGPAGPLPSPKPSTVRPGQTLNMPIPANQVRGGDTAGASTRVDAIERETTRPRSYAEMKPDEKRKFLFQTRVDPILRDLPAKMKTIASGNYKVPGKVTVVAGKVKVSIKMTEFSDANLAKLRALGVVVKASNKSLAMAIGTIPVAKLEDLAQLEFVVRVSPAM